MSRSESKKSSVIHLLGGGISGMVACVVLQPLDLIKTRLQQQRQDHLNFLKENGLKISPHNSTIYSTVKNIVNTNGYSGLWRGTVPTIVRNVPGSAMYFFALSQIRGVVVKTRTAFGQQAHQSRLDSLIAGSVARGSVAFVMMPITVVKVRYESNFYNYHNLGDAFKSTVRADGIRGLFAGYGATIIRDAPFAGIYLFFYENFKSVAKKYNENYTFVNMGSGLLAGMTASTITQPFDMLKTRMQLKPSIYKTLAQSAKKVYLEEGLMGFFDGISVRLIRKPLNSAISWTIYEEVVRWHKLRDQLMKEKL